MAPSLLLALLLSTATMPVPLNDVGAVSTTNGQSTLVAWTNEFSFNRTAFRVYIRLLDSPFDRNAISLGAGFAPRVATNGHGYLVGWSMQPSRFAFLSGDNAVVQRVSAEGVPGVRKVLNQAAAGGVTDIAWNGTHWLVSYSFARNGSHTSRVLLLDDALNVVATVETNGIVRALRRVDDQWWAFSENEAFVMRGDGTIGDRFTHHDPIPGEFFLTRGPRPLILVQSEHLDAIPFDPESGFASQRPFVASTRFLGGIPFEDGSLVLLGEIGRSEVEGAFVDRSGELRSLTSLFFPSQPQYPWASLGLSTNGPLFFFSPAAEESWATGTIDLYAYPLRGLAPVDPASGERVSQVRAPQRRRAASH